MFPVSALCAVFLAVAAAPPPAEASAHLDALLDAKWKALSLSPEATVDGEVFVRRVWLDLAGRVPPALKAREYLDDARPGKRAALVDGLLASEEFAEHWGRAWAIRLTGKRPIRHEVYDGRVLHGYLKSALAANTSYRQIVREIITGEGLRDTSGPANFLLRYEAKPELLAGAVGKHFLGISIHCAQCHDHMFARWKQDDFRGFAAFFSRLKLLNSDDGELTAVLEARRGEFQIPDPAAKVAENGDVPMKVVAPRFLAGAEAPAKIKRRDALADWLTADANPYFARHAVNQVWHDLLGTELVKSLDDVGAAIKSQHGDLLECLAKDFVASGYDLKRLVRTIVLSRAYQLSGKGGDFAHPSATEEDRIRAKLQNFARFRTRPLSVDQLYDSIVQATGHPGSEDAKPDNQSAAEPDDDADEMDRPVELLSEHGRSVQRSLALLNGQYVHAAVQAGAKMTVALHGRGAGVKHIEWLFLATLARRPTADELKTMTELIRTGHGVRGLEDVLWVILNSAEFSSNH